MSEQVDSKHGIVTAKPIKGEQVTIVGAGLTGLTLGLICAREGRPVRIIGERPVPGSRDGLMVAPATIHQELQYHHIWRWLGTKAVQAYAGQLRRGQEFVVATATDLGIAVDRADMATATANGREAFWLRYEARAMRLAGLDPRFDDNAKLASTIRPQLVALDQPVVDPVAYRDALVEAFIASGGVFAESAPPTRSGWTVSTVPLPAAGPDGIRFRLNPATWTWLEVAVAEAPRANFFDLDKGGRIVTRIGDRVYVGSRRDDGLGWVSDYLVGGEVVSRWEAKAAASFDAQPFVGYAGSRPGRRLVACGFDAWELTNGSAAALQLADVIAGNDADLPWRPLRLPRAATVGRSLWGGLRHGLKISPVTPFPRRG